LSPLLFHPHAAVAIADREFRSATHRQIENPFAFGRLCARSPPTLTEATAMTDRDRIANMQKGPRFTGERPGWGEAFQYDQARHLAAYRYAVTLATGLRVLDAGCGDGFGTQILADVATDVVGLDRSGEAIAFCRSTWRKPNLSFLEGDLTTPGSVSERFDLVLNFQVIEHIHIEDVEPFLSALRARLAPGGRLLLTTPNRLRSFSDNPYHVREYTAGELKTLLTCVFPRVTMRGMHGNAKVIEFDRTRERSVMRILRLDPLGMRKLLPAAIINFAFARLAVLVRKGAQVVAGQSQIAADDFSVRDENVDEALDLVALCEA
jgi:2-polyprenyl-3-methyl-5-hydroxy-6-metoxy-1,4-benzoquinol methylase